MMKCPLAAIGVAVASVVTCRAEAAVVYVSASRTVSATLQIPSASQSFPSAALGAYNQTASVSGQDPFGSSEFSSASASQTSDLLADRITYRGSASANDGISASSGSGAGSANSSLIVRFTVSSSTPYALIGPGSFPNGFIGSVSERLVHVESNVMIFNQGISTAGGGSMLNLSGVLEPGTYEFTVGLLAGSRGVGTSFGSASIDRQLAIPAPGAAGVLLLGGMMTTSRRRRG